MQIVVFLHQAGDVIAVLRFIGFGCFPDNRLPLPGGADGRNLDIHIAQEEIAFRVAPWSAMRKALVAQHLNPQPGDFLQAGARGKSVGIGFRILYRKQERKRQATP